MKDETFLSYKLATLFIAALLLQGCVAAAAVPLFYAGVAAGGFSGYKFVQTTTGGTVEIKFSDKGVSEEDNRFFVEIKKIAIWPGDEAGEVYLAEALHNSEKLEIVTPAKTDVFIEKLNIQNDLNKLTNFEMLSNFEAICNESGTDAILCFKPSGDETKINFWSFNRATNTLKVSMLIFSKGKNNVIWSEDIEVIEKIGSKHSDRTEVSKILGETIAEKFLEEQERIKTLL